MIEIPVGFIHDNSAKSVFMLHARAFFVRFYCVQAISLRSRGKSFGRLTALVRIKVSHNLYQCY